MANSSSTPPHPLLESVRQWPTRPGIYLMRDSANRMLYIGKAKSLRNRIRSYFQKPANLPDRTKLLIRRVSKVEFTVTHTELEALLLECTLIKKHRPRYNVRLKDDKNFPYVALDFTHPFPQFRITRKIIHQPNIRYFGPFSAGVNEIGRFLLKTFQLRDCSDQKFKNRTRPCLNYEIGTCTAPCVDLVTEEQYSGQVKDAILFLKGKKRELLSHLRKEMQQASEKQEYERAKAARDKILAIEKLTDKQSAVLTNKLKDIDVVGFHVHDGNVQWVTLFIRNGMLSGRRAERTLLQMDSTEESLGAYLEQLYLAAVAPDEVWVPMDFSGRATLEKFLKNQSKKKVAIQVKRGEQAMRLLGMAAENAKLIFQEGARQSRTATEDLRVALDLPDLPHSIEGIDVSNLQGTVPAVSVVHFADERPLKSRYRLYYPKTVEGQNDFAMIHEVVRRRYRDTDNPPPDLLLIDGGKGQLAVAKKALEECGMEIPVCSLAKARTHRAFHSKTLESSDERVFIPNRKNPVALKPTSPALQLLQQVRNEAHRFCLHAHRERRKKATLETSQLTDLLGIGQKTREKLLISFGSLNAIRKATEEELLASGLTKAQASRILEIPREEE